MTETEIKHIYDDMEIVKKDIALIKHILIEEGELTEEAVKDLEEARKTPKKEYISHEELKKRLLK